MDGHVGEDAGRQMAVCREPRLDSQDVSTGGTFVPLHTKEGKYRIPAVKSAIEEHRGKPANAPQNINATSTARPNPPGRVIHWNRLTVHGWATSEAWKATTSHFPASRIYILVNRQS